MFVALEGPEGGGKSTALRALGERLVELGHSVLLTREPGEGAFGAKVRALLLDGEAIPALSELFLFLADRANHVERVIRPALARGEIVLCDRYADSTLVYQGYARGLEFPGHDAKATLRDLNALATGGLLPDLVLIFDLDPRIGLERQKEKNRLDRESIEFHERVRAGFLDLASGDSRYRVIDASQSAEQVWQDCLEAIFAKLA